MDKVTPQKSAFGGRKGKETEENTVVYVTEGGAAGGGGGGGGEETYQGEWLLVSLV